MKKSIKTYGAFFLMSIAIISCQKTQEEEKNEELTELTHSYKYKGEQYSVTYHLNKEQRFVGMSGDIKTHKEVFSEDNMPSAFLVEKEVNNTYEIAVFDSEEDMNSYDERVYGNDIPEGPADRVQCTNDQQPGIASFRFYRDVNYGDEITSIQQLNVSYFQDQWLNHPSENDAISSISVSSGSVDIFRDNCFRGTQIRFRASVSDLNNIVVYNGYSVAEKIGYDGTIHPILTPGSSGYYYSFSDQTSSIKGWSL